MNTFRIRTLSRFTDQLSNQQLRRPAIVLAFVVALGLASCGQNPAEVAAPPSSPTTAPNTPAKVNEPVKTAPNPAATASAAIPAAIMKLGVKPVDATNCPPNALIKGTMTRKRGNIYQTSKSPDYAQVKPDICFADKATAEKAGFKIPQ